MADLSVHDHMKSNASNDFSATVGIPRTYEGRDLEAMAFACNYHAWIADRFAPYLHGTVLEVGAGTGNFSSMLLKRGTERLVAVEPSVEMYAELSRRFTNDPRVETHKALFAEVEPAYEGKIDTIVYVNVLEHVEEDASELALVHAALRPGGHLCIFVPALSWLYSEFDASIGHHRRYHKKALRTLVERAGFTITKSFYFDFFGILPWLLYFRILGKRLGPKSVGAYDTVVVPIARFLESVAPPPIGKNILLIAQKK